MGKLLRRELQMKHLLIYSVRQIRYMIIITLILFAVAGAFCIHTKAGVFQIMKVYEMFLLPFSACWVICGSQWNYFAVIRDPVFVWELENCFC